MITGPLLVWIQKLAVQHSTLVVKNILTKATIFTPVFQLLQVMIEFVTYELKMINNSAM